MYHSVTFTKNQVSKNTWDDWGLIPTTPPVFPEPAPAFNYVDVPGRNGSLDFTDFLVGGPYYPDRSGSFTFYIQHETKKFSSWAAWKMAIAQFLNGSKMKIVLEDDPDYYCEGRVNLKSWNPGQSFSQLSIDYRVGPFKKRITDDTEVVG